jgi:hypothetical protein
MRGGGRPGFDKLVELQKNAPNESMRLRAKSMLETIGGHADELKKFGESEKRAHLIPILIKEIRTSDDLFQVTTAFLAFRKLTNQPLQVFDMDAVNSWCAEHASQCK